jgi:hypothetical protein
MAWGASDAVVDLPSGAHDRGSWGSTDTPVVPDMSMARDHFESVRGAKTFTDYLQAGWQGSVLGLATRGKAPDIEQGEDSAWYQRLAASIAGIAGDAPAMVAGALGGAAAGGLVGGGGGAAAGSVVPVAGTAAGATVGAGAGTIVGGYAGAGALPAGLRAAMMEAYTKGEVTSSTDFVERALHVAWETAKGGITGGAMGKAGIMAKSVLPVAAPAIVKGVTATGAEVATMATVGKALEGQLPEPSDFLDAALLLAGSKGAADTAAKLRLIYTRTGKGPAEVLADARQNPELAAEIKAPIDGAMIEIPAEYRPAAAAESARAAVPDYRSNEGAALDVTAMAKQPFAEIPQANGEPAQPTHVNYAYLNAPEDAAAALSRLSSIYEERIQAQRRGSVSWEQTSTEAAQMLNDTIGGKDASLLMPREPGTPAGAAEILARKQLVVGAAEDMASRARDYAAKGATASPEETLAFFASIERASMIQAEFLGARAEAGRALNVLKSTARDAERVKQIQQVVDMYGKDPVKLAGLLGEIDNPAGALKFAKEATKATTWEKVVEAWKAGLLSGVYTHVANITGNAVFMAVRLPIDSVAATLGLMRGAKPGERVAVAEPVARVMGAVGGSLDAIKVAGAIIRTGEQPGKAETHRGAIEGVKGQVIRLPFRFLSAEDAIFKTLNERGELHTLAVRQASAEGLNPLTREFRERVGYLLDNPTEEALASAQDAAERFTFNKELGEKGQAVQKFVRAWHLEWALPFIRTPSNIIKEMTRLTPLAPLVKEWRDAIAEGGVARDKALAELTVGTTLMTGVFVHALQGNVSGAGEPDAGKKRVQQAAGWQPYSVKVGDKWYSYDRIQPIGTLMGMAADLSEVWDHLTDEEADKVPKMLAVAFSNAVTNQTFLQGITKIVNAMSDPKRFAPKFVRGLAGSLVPAAVGQTAQMMDPMARETDSMLDAIKSRIPGMRNDLLPKRDIFGQPVENPERVAGVLPVKVKQESDDKVRTEAERLGISVADTPKKAHVGRGTGKLGEVPLEPGQRDTFAQVGGELAHAILAPIVNSPQWDALPPLVQKKAYAKAFLAAHKQAAIAAVPPELRATLLQEITEKVAAQLVPGDQ